MSIRHLKSNGLIIFCGENMKLLFTVSFIILLYSILLADSIKLINGQIATVSILDTNGCSISINRNGNIVNIKKELIESITIGQNIISYANFKCIQEGRQGKKVEINGDLVSTADSTLNLENQIYTVNKLAVGKDTDKNTKRLPKISYNSADIVINPGGMQYFNGMWTNTGPTTITKRRFYVEGEQGVKRIGPLGSTLSSYLSPVPEAHRKMVGYGVCHFIGFSLLVGGLATMIGSISSQADGKHSNLNLTGVFIGLGISATSFIPYVISKNLPEDAVNIYNANLNNSKYNNKEREKPRTQKK